MAEIGDVAAYLTAHELKELLRFVTVGSVDDGKSTLIGRLLYDTQGIYQDQLAAVQRASRKKNAASDSIDLSLLTDGLRAEREQGITIDVAYRYFSTAKRKFIIADTPGHVQYTRNMATGASTADVALILIDARLGVLQQSRRHAYIASLLGIPHLAVCVNKMDLCGFSQELFEQIRRELAGYAGSLRFKDVRFFPISATRGDNVVTPSVDTPWHGGGTLLSYLESVPISGDANLRDFRYPVQLVLRPDLHYRGFAGRVASGVVRRGDEIMVLPSGQRSRVLAIDGFDGEIEEAFAPMSVSLRLSDEIDCSRGDMLVHPDNLPLATRRFEADVVWLSEQPLDRSRAYFLKHTSKLVRASIEQVESRVDLETLVEVPCPTLELNDIGRLHIASNQPLLLDPYERNRVTGAFVLVDALSNNTVAAGMVRRALEDQSATDQRRHHSLVGDAEREGRFGQRGIAVWFAGAPSERQEVLAYALERALFDAGRAVTVIDVAAVADGTRSPALLADIASQCVRAGMIAILSTAPPRDADRRQLCERLAPERRLELQLDDQDVAAIVTILSARVAPDR